MIQIRMAEKAEITHHVLQPTKEISTRQIWKNIILISLAFLLVFNGFQGLARLQSSLHRVEGMGTTCSSLVYVSLITSCLFLPRGIISVLGHKWTIPASFIAYILLMAANGYAVWSTMVTTSVLVGISAAPLWTAQCSYFTVMAGEYSRLTGLEEKDVISRFFGVFFMFFQLTAVTGSIVSSTALMSAPVNGSFQMSAEDISETCGAQFCPWANYTNPNLDKPDPTMVWTMLGVYMAVALTAVVMVCVFVDNLPNHLRGDPTNTRREIPQLALATIRQMSLRPQQLLIPLTVYSGLEQAYFNAEFSEAFVSCGLGIWKVGLVTLPYGCVNALVSLTSGQLVKYIGRTPFFVTAAVVDLSIQLTLMLWVVNPSQQYVLFLLAACWGLSDGIWQTQINALYGELFTGTSEAAFSNYRLWESLGFAIGFSYSSSLCTSVKSYILVSVLCLGLIGFFIVKYKFKPSKGHQGNTGQEYYKKSLRHHVQHD